MMELEDIQKVWDSQRNEPLYLINEEAMHKHIESKKMRASRIANFCEWLIMATTIGAGSLILSVHFLGDRGNGLITVLAGMMVLAGVYVWVGRKRRKKRENQFRQSMLSDLEHAITTARYQVQLSQKMRWFGIFVLVIALFSLWQKEKNIVIIIGGTIFSCVVFAASQWEHNWYVRQKRSLESLRDKVTSKIDEDGAYDTLQ